MVDVRDHGMSPLATIVTVLFHGCACVENSWALMALILVPGGMNFEWMAIMVLIVLLKGIAPGMLDTKLTGKILICWEGVVKLGVNSFFPLPESMLDRNCEIFA